MAIDGGDCRQKSVLGYGPEGVLKTNVPDLKKIKFSTDDCISIFHLPTPFFSSRFLRLESSLEDTG